MRWRAGILVSRVTIESVTAGSVVVSFSVLPDPVSGEIHHCHRIPQCMVRLNVCSYVPPCFVDLPIATAYLGTLHTRHARTYHIEFLGTVCTGAALPSAQLSGAFASPGVSVAGASTTAAVADLSVSKPTAAGRS
jgi:hypothetical protein